MSRQTGVYFVDGTSPRGELLGVVAYLHELKDKDAEYSRFYTVLSGTWRHQEINSQVVSLVYRKRQPSWWLLGRRGEITVIEPAGRTEETLPHAGTGPGKAGYVDKIREIEGNLYVCGYQRQVYRRDDRFGWTPIDAGIRSSSAEFGIGLTSIDGSSENDIYAVGRRGEIFHHSDGAWTRCESPTNVHLRDVRCLSSELVYVAGNDGVLLRGSRNTWELIRDDAFSHNLWSVEEFKDSIYVSSSFGLARLEGDGLRLIETGHSSPTNGYKLSSNVEAMWSIGTDEILRFDGNEWVKYPCPDNEEAA